MLKTIERKCWDLWMNVQPICLPGRILYDAENSWFRVLGRISFKEISDCSAGLSRIDKLDCKLTAAWSLPHLCLRTKLLAQRSLPWCRRSNKELALSPRRWRSFESCLEQKNVSSSWLCVSIVLSTYFCTVRSQAGPYMEWQLRCSCPASSLCCSDLALGSMSADGERSQAGTQLLLGLSCEGKEVDILANVRLAWKMEKRLAVHLNTGIHMVPLIPG